MTHLDREFFAEIARTYTGVACLAQTLAVGCQSSGHGLVADPAEVEARLWLKISALRAGADGLLAARAKARLGAGRVVEAWCEC